MAYKYVKIVFDRKKTAHKSGKGVIELRVKINSTTRKSIYIGKCSPLEWPTFENSAEVRKRAYECEAAMEKLYDMGEPPTVERLCELLGIGDVQVTVKKHWKNFLEFMEADINNANLKEGTLKHKRVVLDSLKEFGYIVEFSDLTPANLKQYDSWLHRPIKKKDIKAGHHSGEDVYKRSDACVHNYHKQLKVAVRSAVEQGFLKENPYNKIHFALGKNKERQPLTEDELSLVMNAKLPAVEERVRDLFVFSCYTGLAYADVKSFDYKTMVEQHGEDYYIVGKRQKTDNSFYTPLLPPALKILEKYKYELPVISNQKANQYLHLIEKHLGLTKPLTFHVARHTFATLLLNMDVPIEHVQRMLGHSNLKTTLIYAKLQTKTLQRSSQKVSSLFRKGESNIQAPTIQPVLVTSLPANSPSAYYYTNSTTMSYSYSM